MSPTLLNLLPASLLATLALTLVACGGGNSSDTAASPSIQSRLQGTWEQRGYGRMLEIVSDEITLYDFTSQTCARGDTEELEDIAAKLDTIDDDSGEFTLRDAPVGFVTRYTRTDALPDTCSEPIGSRPSEIFNHVWHTFNEYYAFFAERGVDWLAQYDAVRDRIHDDMSDAELFEVLQTLLQPIDDVHVAVTMADGTSYSPGQPKGFFQDLLAEFEAQSEVSDVDSYIVQELNSALAIVDLVYLEGEYSESGGPSGDFFKWGVIGDNTGYLNIGAFILGFDQTIADQLADVERIIDEILTDLNGTESLIIDVRLSPGGADPIALAVANRFADAQRLAIRKITRTVAGESAGEEAFVEPSGRVAYSKPVVVLTSGFSASATEVFTLAMRTMPQVTVIGEATIGALSDILEKPLPNGWQIDLANEVYFDADGTSFEAVGIPPDIAAPAYGKQAREAGQDSALNAALSHLGLETP